MPKTIKLTQAQVAQIIEALSDMKYTYMFAPPCHDWESKARAHNKASAALKILRGEE